MLSLPPTVKIFLCPQATDMRKSFNGLSAAIKQVLGQDPFCGHLFVFFNRRRDQVRILFWDRNGFSILAKRLEKGCFKLPACESGKSHVDIEAADLALILEGIDLNNATRRKRWNPEQKAA